MSFGSNLRQAMRARGIGTAELARRLGIRSQSVSQWCSDQTRPTGARFDALCRLLGVSADVLIAPAGGLAEPRHGLDDPERARILAEEERVFAALAARIDTTLRELDLPADGPTVAVLARRVWGEMEALRGTSLPLEERMELALSETRAALERARATRRGR